MHTKSSDYTNKIRMHAGVERTRQQQLSLAECQSTVSSQLLGGRNAWAKHAQLMMKSRA